MANHEPQIGYLVKQAQALLRLRMEESLHPIGLTVSQYSCLQQLQREPRISAAELARGVFMTRQSMSTMLQLLLERGLVQRPSRAETGRALPTELTPAGVELLSEAQSLVAAVEQRMLSGLDKQKRDSLASALASCAAALADEVSPADAG